MELFIDIIEARVSHKYYTCIDKKYSTTFSLITINLTYLFPYKNV